MSGQSDSASATSFLEDFIHMKQDIRNTKAKVSEISENLVLAHSDDRDLVNVIDQLFKAFEDVGTALSCIEIKVREYAIKHDPDEEFDVKVLGADTEEYHSKTCNALESDDHCSDDLELPNISRSFSSANANAPDKSHDQGINDDNYLQMQSKDPLENISESTTESAASSSRKRERKQKLSTDARTYQKLRVSRCTTFEIKSQPVALRTDGTSNASQATASCIVNRTSEHTPNTVGTKCTASQLFLSSLPILRVSIDRITPTDLNLIQNRMRNIGPQSSKKTSTGESAEIGDDVLHFNRSSNISKKLSSKMNTDLSNQSNQFHSKSEDDISGPEDERLYEAEDSSSSYGSQNYSNSCDEEYILNPLKYNSITSKKKASQLSRKAKTTATIKRTVKKPVIPAANSTGTQHQGDEAFKKPRYRYRPPPKKFECPKKCGRFLIKLNLSRHVKYCSGFKDTTKLREDIDDQLTNMENSKKSRKKREKLECPKQCGTFLTKIYLERHVKTCPGFKPALWVCQICNQICHTRCRLKAHTRIHTAEKTFMCDICSKMFLELEGLKVHVNSVHSIEPNYKCNLCSKAFKHRSSLESHKKIIHFEVAPPSIQCSICGKLFLKRQNLTRHCRAVHENRRPHKCEKCDKAFKEKTNLIYHLKTHDNPNSKKRGLNRVKDVLNSSSSNPVVSKESEQQPSQWSQSRNISLKTASR